MPLSYRELTQPAAEPLTLAQAKAHLATLQKQMSDTLASFNQWSSTNLKSLQAKQARGGRYTYSGDITDIEGATLTINDRFGNLQAKQQDDETSRRQKQLEGQKEAAQKAKEALDKLIASIKQAAETIKSNQTEVADAAREGLIMPHPLVGLFGQPSSNLQAELPRADLSKNSDMERGISGQSKFQFQWLTNLNQYTAIQSENADAIAQASLQMDIATGAISAHDAAVKLASIHTAEYTEQIDALFSQLDNLKSLRDSGAISLNEFSARSTSVLNQMGTLNGQRQIQFAQDEQGINSTTVAGATKNALAVMVQSWTDMSKQIPDLLVSSLDEVNRSLASALMAHTHTGREYRRGIENALSQSARGIGTNLLNTSFQGIEGSAMKKLFGIGGKPDGTASNPIHTIVDKADGAGNAAGLLNGGSLSKLLGSIGGGIGKAGSWFGSLIAAIPHFAGGGDFLAGRPMLVGEMGPEIVSFGSPGHIIPNSAISSGDTNHLYIDARGSNDPAATEQAVHRAMRQYIPGIVSMSVGAVSERQKRVALSRRA